MSEYDAPGSISSLSPELQPRASTIGAALVVGESLIDIIENKGKDTLERVGGSPANVAIGLARLGHPVKLATWFGSDERGARIREHLEANEVEVAAGSDRAPRTSTSRAAINANGSATYTFEFNWDLPPLVPTHTPAVLHFGSVASTREPGATKVARIVTELGGQATVTYDPNIRSGLMAEAIETRQQVERLIALADVVKASHEDIEWLVPGQNVLDVARSWLMRGPAIVVITHGVEGATAITAAGINVSVPTPTVGVSDTVGAGDSFMSGLIHGLAGANLLGPHSQYKIRGLSARPLHAVLAQAATIAAITVSRDGSDPPHIADLLTNTES